MEVPKSVVELLKNPIFKGVNVKTLNKAINKKFDKDPCKQPSIIVGDADGKCVFPMTDADKKKMVNSILDGVTLPVGIRKADITTQLKNKNTTKYINPLFNPDTVSQKCTDNCISNVNKMVETMKSKIVSDTNQFQKFDSRLSDYYASSILFHNAFYSLLTYYKYKNDNAGVRNLKEKINAIKYTNTSVSVIGKYFINRMKTLVSGYKSDIGGFDYQYSIFSRTMPVTIVEIGLSNSARTEANNNLKTTITNTSNQIKYKNQLNYSISTDKIKSGVVNNIMAVYGKKPTDAEASDSNYVKNKQTQLANLLISNDNKLGLGGVRDNAKKIGYNFFTGGKEEYAKGIDKLLASFILKHNSIITLLDDVDVDNVTKKAKTSMGQIMCCNNTLAVPADKKTNYKKDTNNKTFSAVNAESDISQNAYWKEFTKYLNVVSLLPIYWKIGLILPTPGGPLRIPLPIIFIHIVTIKIGCVIIVIWLTINGMVIVPVVYTLQFMPIADSASVWLVLFRGANKKIKDKTGVEVMSMPPFGGINLTPEVSKTFPFKKDDLPTIERLGMTNPLYLVYLNQMLQAATPSMGLP